MAKKRQLIRPRPFKLNQKRLHTFFRLLKGKGLVIIATLFSSEIPGIDDLTFIALHEDDFLIGIAVLEEKTNVDTIIGKKGIVLQRISPDEHGLVRVGNEEWRARADESIEKDEAVIVADIGGVTLKVKKTKGEN